MGKHDKKKEPLDLKVLTANGIVALVVGIILLLIEKYII